MAEKKRETFSFLKKRTIHDLILFCLFRITENKETASVERLVEECFILFPKSFGLLGYSKWPDSRKLGRALRSLRKKKSIVGNPKTFFTLTTRGKKEVGDMLKDFRQKKLL